MLGAPWLQHRTAELARKLKQPEVAALHYRRAAAAFIRAGFPKRALAPLRTAWQLSIALLPGNASAFITISLELANVQRELGFAADAKLTLTNSEPRARNVGQRRSRAHGSRSSSAEQEQAATRRAANHRTAAWSAAFKARRRAPVSSGSGNRIVKQRERCVKPHALQPSSACARAVTSDLDHFAAFLGKPRQLGPASAATSGTG